MKVLLERGGEVMGPGPEAPSGTQPRDLEGSAKSFVDLLGRPEGGRSEVGGDMAVGQEGPVLHDAQEPRPGEEAADASMSPGRASIQDAAQKNPYEASLEAALAHMARSLNVPDGKIVGPQSSLASSMEVLPEALRTLVERILVEVPGSSSRNEVRIQLHAEMFPGTDIRIFREAGELVVLFVTTSSEVQDVLGPHLTSLREHLELHGESVAVGLQYTGTTSDGQSDGRSRQRYTGWDMDGEGQEK